MGPHAGLKKFFLALAGILFVIAAVYVVYRIADAALDHTQPGTASLPVSFAGSSAVSSSVPSGIAESSAPVPSSEPETRPPAVEGLFSAYSGPAQEKLNSMTLKEKVGQVFVFRCPDTGAAETARTYQPGGYCLMASNFQGKTTSQVKTLLASFQTAGKTKMALCCDEEGGTVVRISKYPALAKTPFRSPQAVFRSGGMNGITADTVKKAKLLKSLGLNLNLAPVCDVSTGSSDFIYERAFGKNAAQTADFVTASVNAYNSQKLSCTLKHFPGYGNNKDTHTGIAYDKRSLSTFEQSDFLPFAAGISAGAQCVLVSHTIVDSMDEKQPASLSPKVHEILRRQLGFTGIIITDDLSMGAIRDYTGKKNPCPAAFLAGNEMLLSSKIAEENKAHYYAVQRESETESRLDESVLRILAWKYAMGILT